MNPPARDGERQFTDCDIIHTDTPDRKGLKQITRPEMS